MIQVVRDVLFPPTCILCKGKLVKSFSIICLSCELHLPLSFRSKGVQPIERALWGRIRLEWASALYAFSRGSSTQELLHFLKYNSDPETVKAFGKKMGKAIASRSDLICPDAVVPIPLHPKKRKQRGYNQAEELASGVAEILQIEHKPFMLQRKDHAASLTQLGRTDRWQRISDAYLLNQDVRGLNHVLLVDDVLTTGATIEVCANLLQDAGVSRVSVATLAFADKLL